jgi:glyoxylase-like metal-dependent hydrolase (beta-lactamase superfamily II)
VRAIVGTDRDGEFLLASDAVPLRVNLDPEIIPRNTADAEAAARSMAEVRRLQAGGTTVVFGHDEGQWQQLRKGFECYE